MHRVSWRTVLRRTARAVLRSHGDDPSLAPWTVCAAVSNATFFLFVSVCVKRRDVRVARNRALISHQVAWAFGRTSLVAE